MTGRWVYPKRTDGVFAIRFDGSQESAREISDTLQLVIRYRISPNPAALAVLEIGNLDPIKVGQYVIIDENHDLLDVLDYDTYSRKYTE
jgi:hypothetical protein